MDGAAGKHARIVAHSYAIVSRHRMNEGARSLAAARRAAGPSNYRTRQGNGACLAK